MATIALDPVSRNMVMYDILNEPDARGIGWEGAGPGRSMSSNYLAVMDQVRPPRAQPRQSSSHQTTPPCDPRRSRFIVILVLQPVACICCSLLLEFITSHHSASVMNEPEKEASSPVLP